MPERTISNTGLEEQIRQYVAKNLLFSEDGFGYDNDISFLREGLVDSMGVLELVMFVSASFGIEVDPLDVTPDNFDSVNKLARYIRTHAAPSNDSERRAAC